MLSGHTWGTGIVVTIGSRPQPTCPSPVAPKSFPCLKQVSRFVLSTSTYSVARMFSGGPRNSTRKRWPSGTRFSSTIRTPTVPVPSPATWAGAPAAASWRPSKGGLGRASTTFLGRIRPPRGVWVTLIAFSEGKTRSESYGDSTPKS